jgi:hypothetical protein
VKVRRKDDAREGEVFATVETIEDDNTSSLGYWVRNDPAQEGELWLSTDCEEVA